MKVFVYFQTKRVNNYSSFEISESLHTCLVLTLVRRRETQLR